jgi:signal transduction histidine kinase
VLGSTVFQLALLFTVQTVVFTILLIILFPGRKDVYIWSWSNVLAAGSVLIVGSPFESLPAWLTSLSTALNLFGGALKVLAYGGSNIRMRRPAFPTLAMVITLLLGILLILFPMTPYKLLMLATGGSLCCLASLYFVLTNHAWAGIKAQWISVVTLAMAAVGIGSKAVTAYPFGPYTTFMRNNSEQAINLVMLVLFSFIIQISFLSLIAGRSARDQIFFERRSARLQARTRVLTEDREKLLDVAAERMSLLRMLTHEVRQPLNNAQAALQTILNDLSGGTRSPELLIEMANRAQRTVGDVVLAISNSIIGATLVSSARQPALEQSDLHSIARLAILDIDPAYVGRITDRYDQAAIFAAVDPVLLRLAIRNLLENALKFSPLGKDVMFDVGIDEDRMVATFAVSNTVADQSLVIDDMFGFEKRGSDSRYGGMGLGLFIVKRCAELHGGDVSYKIDDANIITFELSIPC